MIDSMIIHNNVPIWAMDFSTFCDCLYIASFLLPIWVWTCVAAPPKEVEAADEEDDTCSLRLLNCDVLLLSPIMSSWDDSTALVAPWPLLEELGLGMPNIAYPPLPPPPPCFPPPTSYAAVLDVPFLEPPRSDICIGPLMLMVCACPYFITRACRWFTWLIWVLMEDWKDCRWPLLRRCKDSYTSLRRKAT